jgi:uncharacterized protein
MQKALAPEISTRADENPQLIGSACGTCGTTAFPGRRRCPKCRSREMSEILLPRRGTLVTWTTQGFPPGAPHKGPTSNAFVPFGVGLVQLGLVQFGTDVELTTVPLTADDDGTRSPRSRFSRSERGPT